MKIFSITLVASLFMSLAAHASNYVCFNKNNYNPAGTEESASLKAVLSLEGDKAVLKVLMNTDTAPANWKLNANKTYSLNLKSIYNPDYAYFVSSDGRLDISIRKLDLGSSSFQVNWDITAIPATRDEVAYGTNSRLMCWEQ